MKKLFQKSDSLIKSMFKDQEPEHRYFIVKLGAPSSNERIGYLRALFEIVDGIVCAYDPATLCQRSNGNINQVESIFVRGGYDLYFQKYQKEELFIVQAHTLESSDGECLLGVFYDNRGYPQHHKIDKSHPFIARVFDSEEIDIVNDEIVKEEKFLHISKKENTVASGTPLSFYFNDDEQFFGPLFDKKSSTLHGFDLPNPIKIPFMKGKKVSDFKTYKIEFKNNYIEDNLKHRTIFGETYLYAINIGMIFTNEDEIPTNNIFEQYDTIPTNSILSKASKLLKSKPAAKLNIESIIKGRELNELSDDRKSIIERTFKLSNNNSDESKKLVELIINSNIFDSEIIKFFEQQPTSFIQRFSLDKNIEFAKITREIEEKKIEADEDIERYKENKTDEINRDLIELTAKKTNIVKKIDTNRVLLESLENELIIKKSQLEDTESIQELAAEKSEKIKELSLELDDLQRKHKLSTDIDKLREELVYQQRRIHEETNKKSELEDVTKSIQNDMNMAESELAKRFLESKIISDLVEGDYHKHLSRANESNVEVVNISSPSIDKNENLTRTSIIEIIHERFKGMNREIPLGDLAAYLTAIFQNQFTVLLGSPGTGKTSFAEQLTYAIGSSDKTLSTLINVGKGWTEPKMLQGYYNPITKKYDAGSTGFYPLMDSLNNTAENELPMSFIIYDEFNLSSPEYYLSNQLGLADKKSNRKLVLGNDIEIRVPMSTRFICTANTDESVEGLTPRVINRCAFISFNSNHISYDFDCEELTYNRNDMLGTGDQIVEAFKPSTSDFISSDMKAKLEDLYEIFIDKLKTNLSPRRKEQIKNFVLTSSNISFVNENLVLDHTLGMFLIPLIKGSGEGYEEHLIELKEKMENYDLIISVELLNEVIDSGQENFKHFSFSIA
ncbi:hypothetical protein [Shewanella youngdeokensis]|uniref:AAA+ ATPase domain-containing protein n=1 Tax=Shewanella youngdeokensis TaxID=2999068 RepID=A0ABZ0K2K4_9GAMM|nr:hypothetical protein RGE70_05310 [Shewanella sp. DAU334]